MVIGFDGAGKTWATLDWLVHKQTDQPIVLIIPSSAVAPDSGVSETALKRFLAERLYDLTAVRDSEHWLHRLDLLLKRPPKEGPVLTVFLDGLNEEPSVPWQSILTLLQGQAFEGRVRVIVSTRRHHFEQRLSGLRGLVVRAVPIIVDLYDTSPGGELDQMLAFEGLKQADLHPNLVDLARTPRLFNLVIRFRDRLVEAGHVTVHRLLWEYGRDSFGERAGRSFSEEDWRAWLSDVARRYRDGIRAYSLRSLGEAASRPDLTEREVYARLSDIIDGRFAIPGPAGEVQLNPTVVSHALGAAPLADLDAIAAVTFSESESTIATWLDPLAGLDQRAEILRAAVSILVERGGPNDGPVAGALVTAWLQSQNVTDSHRQELAMLAPNIPDALLDAVEQSDARSQTSARLWAVNALRTIPRTEGTALTSIAARTARWFSVISRDVDDRPDASPDFERRRAERYRARIGVDVSGLLTVLGVELRLVDRDDGRLQATVPSIIEGFSLAKLLPCFERAFIGLALRGHADAWKGLKWLCWLNEVDPHETAAALRSLSAEIRGRRPETGIHPKLAARVAALLLWATGHETDEEIAASIDDRLDDGYSYERDYLAKPSRSFFALERRHAELTLLDKQVAIQQRLHRTHELWLDPTFEPPAEFVEELRAAAISFEVEKLHLKMGYTPEEWFFEQLEPALARCAPDLLAELMRRKLGSFATRPSESRYASAINARHHFILAGATEALAARVLRLSGREADENHEGFAASELLDIELRSIPDAPTQFDTLIAADLRWIPADFREVVRQPTPDEVDALIARHGSGTAKQQRDVAVLLSVHPVAFSDGAWAWLTAFLDEADDENLHGVVFRMLSLADAARFGRDLVARGWSWNPQASFWVNHYGSEALIKAETALPFDQLAPRVAPWYLLQAARVRGADPGEVRLAAEVVGNVLRADSIDEPDPGSDLSVDRADRRFAGPMLSVQPRPVPEHQADPSAALRAMADPGAAVEAHKRAVETATRRIEEARRGRADLYLTDIDPADLGIVLKHTPELLQCWIEGYREVSADFRRRVRLAEGAYLAICESLLSHDPPRGADLWRSLRRSMATRYVGACGVDELVHIPFRVPDSEAVAQLRQEMISLPFCRTDLDLVNIAAAASYNAKSDWLERIASADQASPLVWRQRRGIMLAALGIGNVLPVPEAWPDGPLRTDRAELRRNVARFRWNEACARHWWHAYFGADGPEQAYGAWVLFLGAADIRVRSWMAVDVKRQSTQHELFRLKLAHAELNRRELKSAMDKRMEKSNQKFLDEDIVQTIGPWAMKSD